MFTSYSLASMLCLRQSGSSRPCVAVAWVACTWSRSGFVVTFRFDFMKCLVRSYTASYLIPFWAWIGLCRQHPEVFPGGPPLGSPSGTAIGDAPSRNSVDNGVSARRMSRELWTTSMPTSRLTIPSKNHSGPSKNTNPVCKHN